MGANSSSARSVARCALTAPLSGYVYLLPKQINTKRFSNRGHLDNETAVAKDDSKLRLNDQETPSSLPTFETRAEAPSFIS